MAEIIAMETITSILVFPTVKNSWLKKVLERYCGDLKWGEGKMVAGKAVDLILIFVAKVKMRCHKTFQNLL